MFLLLIFGIEAIKQGLKEEYARWFSPNLGKDIEMLVFGHSGVPVIAFPTSMGRYYQNKDFGLIDAVGQFVDAGAIKIYCPDSIDELSWYNKGVSPAQRVRNHRWYDRMLVEELVPRIQHETGNERVAVAGCSFGAYHATNFAFRHPGLVRQCMNMGGAFDISSRLDGFFNEDAYYNNPVSFIKDLNNPDVHRMGLVFGVGQHDFCLNANLQISGLLHAKNVQHWLDVVPGGNHDWPVWREMFPRYIQTMFN